MSNEQEPLAMAREARDWMTRHIQAQVMTVQQMMTFNEVHDHVAFIGVVHSLSADLFEYVQVIMGNHPEMDAADALTQAIGDMCAASLLLGAHLRTLKLL